MPTLAVVHEILESGAEAGMPQESIDKVEGMLDTVLASIESCRRAGVKIGMGTDLFGTEFHDMQASEMRYRSAVDRPIDILRSATSVNAEIAQRGDDLGRVAPGYFADLLVLDGNPLDDIGIFERYRAQMPLIMKGGAFIRNELG